MLLATSHFSLKENLSNNETQAEAAPDKMVSFRWKSHKRGNLGAGAIWGVLARQEAVSLRLKLVAAFDIWK